MRATIERARAQTRPAVHHKEIIMTRTHHPMLTRRGFCLCCVAATAFGASGGWLTPREAFAQAKNIVDLIREHAVTDPIKVTKQLRYPASADPVPGPPA
jgi:hypothetical protein